MSAIEVPKNATRKVTLSTGRVVYFRKPTMRDQRYASKAATDSRGVQIQTEVGFELMMLLIVEIRRKNGERVEFHNPKDLFDSEKILTYEEQMQLVQAAPEIVQNPKGEPVVERL